MTIKGDSMQPAPVPDPLHELALPLDLARVNERTVREYGPLPPGGLRVEHKRKPKPWRPTLPAGRTPEGEGMKLSHMVAAAALGVSGALAACGPADTVQEVAEAPAREYTDFDYPPAGTPSPSGVVPARIPTLPNGQVHIDTSKPIPFDRHSFTAHCFDTYGCRVRYAGLQVLTALTNPDDERQPASESLGERYPDAMAGSGILGIRNFPLPAEVTWRDKDGNPHEATVDIAAIFKDQVVLHKVPQGQLKPILTAPIYPRIVLEVNDRTINVWMRAMVFTTVLQKPGNPYSDMRYDMILAYSQTY